MTIATAERVGQPAGHRRETGTAAVPSPLFLPGWVEFNRRKWGVEPLHLRLAKGGADLPAIEAILYADRRGRIRQPLLNPYAAITFQPTPTQSQPRLSRQWLEVSELLAELVAERGSVSPLHLPPDIVDVRSWQWRGFHATVKYTFVVPLPLSVGHVDPMVRKQINKATRAGYRAERTDDLDGVHACLADTAARQRFPLHLERDDLTMLLDLLGPEVCRVYGIYAPTGEMASARIVLHVPGAPSIDWVTGTRVDHLTSGVTQQLIHFVMDDVHTAGATAFDFEGANLPSIAGSKANWGGVLVPFYSVDAPRLKSFVRRVGAIWRFQHGAARPADGGAKTISTNGALCDKT